MASAAQRAWAARGRANAASAPASTRILSSVDRARGTTKQDLVRESQKGKTVPMPRSSEGGLTKEEAILKAAEYQYGKGSSQVKAAQVAVAKAQFVPGEIGGLKVISDIKELDKLQPPKYPHGTPLTTAAIHQRETLFGGATVETLPEALKGKSGEIIKYQVKPTEKAAKRAWVNLQSSESKLQTGEAQLFLAEQRLGKWDRYIKDGAFVGSESQYNQYVNDFGKYQKTANRYDKTYATYDAAFNKADSTGKQLEQYQTDAHRAKYGGLMGTYEDAETKAAERIAAGKVEFKEKHPLTAQRINDVAGLIKQASESQVTGYTPSGFGTVTKMQDPMKKGLQLDQQSIDAVASLSQREFASGFIQQAGKKPIKTAAMVGVGLVTPPALKGVGKVGKALGAGRTVSAVGKAGLYGMGGMYVVGTGVKYMDAGTPREKGAVLGEAVFQEIVPLFAGGYIGTKAIPAASKTVEYTTQRVKFVSKQFKTNSARMFTDDAASAQMSFGKTPQQKLEDAIKLQEKLKKGKLTPEEIKYLENKYKTKRLKSAESIREERIKKQKEKEVENKRKVSTGEYKEVKIGSGAQQQIQLVKVEQKPLTKQSLKEVVKLKQEFRTLQEPKAIPAEKQVVKKKQFTKPKQEQFQTFGQMKEAQRLKQLQSQKQALKQQYRQKHITKQVYKQKLAQLNKQLLKLAQSQKQTLKQVQKTASSLSVAVLLTPKSMSDVKTLIDQAPKAELKPKQKTKLKAKALLKPKQKTKTITTTAQKQKAAQKTRTARKAVEQAKRKRIVRGKAKPKELIKPIIPPPIPAYKIDTKKKRISKKKVSELTLNQKNLNAVATFKRVMGSI